MMNRKISIRLASLLFAFLLLFSIPVSARAEEPAVLEARKSVVRVVTCVQVSYNHELLLVSGTGFFVGDAGKSVQYVVTNRHVVDEDMIIEEIRAGSSLYRNSKIEAIDVWVLVDGKANKIDFANNAILSQITDLAVLKLDKPVSGRAAAVLGDPSKVQTTDVVYAIGYPAYSDWEDLNNSSVGSSTEDYILKVYTSGIDNLSVTKGNVVKASVVSGGISNIEHDANLSYGNSGGPLVLENGQVVGVNTWSDSAGGATAFYSLDTSNVKMLLSQNNIPFVDGASISASSSSTEPAPTPVENEPAPENKTINPVYIIAGAAVVLIAVIAIVAASAKKKKAAKARAAEAEAKAKATAAAPRPLSPVVRSLAQQHGNRKVSLGADAILLGRTSECKIMYKDGTPGVSGKHCAITWDADKNEFIVKDMGSTYGTFMESGMKLEPGRLYRLKPGESIYLGEKDNTVRMEVE